MAVALTLILWTLAGPRDARALALVAAVVDAQASLISPGAPAPDIDSGTSVSVAVSDGTFGQPFEARSAARGTIADSTEHAANFFVEDRALGFFTATADALARVTKVYEVDESGPVELFVNFTLPPGFLELEDNQETGAATGSKDLFLSASLRICGRLDCLGREVAAFLFEADLEGNYDGIDTSGFSASSDDPNLDLSHFDDDAVDVDDQGFLRVFTLDYDTFQGRASAGIWNPGDQVNVLYQLRGFVGGEFANSRAVGAINDPFFLESDQVSLFDNVTLEAVELPEPGVGPLLAIAVVGLVVRRRRR